MTIYMPILAIFFTTALITLNKVLTPKLNSFFALLSLLIVLTLPFIAMIDEGNSSHIAPLEKIHYWIMCGFVPGILIWIYLSMLCLNELHLSEEKLHWKQFLIKYLIVGLVILTVNLYQYTYAYTQFANWYTNQNIEASCEWLVISMCLFLPYVYSLVFPNTKLSLVIE